MMGMPDGHGRIELSRYIEPLPAADHRTAPANALGYLRVMFEVQDLDYTLRFSVMSRHADKRPRVCDRETPSGVIPEHWPRGEQPFDQFGVTITYPTLTRGRFMTTANR